MQTIVKKIFRFIGKTILGLFIALAIIILVMTVYNRIRCSQEKELLAKPTGQFVEVDGHNMNIFVSGDGDHTIVLLSGLGTESPIYDFKPLYTKLSDDHKCVVIEKFGYGFGDEVEGERDFDTILRQDREALLKAGIKPPYVLCAHSLSGLEATLWAQKYPDEVEAIVGLDMTLGNYPGYADKQESSSNKTINNINKVVRFVGLNRFLMSISDYDDMSDAEIKQYIALVCKNQGNDTVMRENDGIRKACEEISAYPLPDVPTLQYLDTSSNEDEIYKSSCQKIIDASVNGKMIQLDCGHYVHHFESERIASDISQLINDLN